MSFNEKLIMEKELNIAEILKDKPRGTTKLWSPAYGQCELYDVRFALARPIEIKVIDDTYRSLSKDARICKGGEPMLFPSKEMRDWEKFAWKKGDVLINSCGFQCIFKEWTSDDYTKFNGCYSNSRDGYEDVLNADTMKFQKVDNNIACGYLREIEETLGGKLNLSTLEIEKPLQFKDGDILTYCGFIFIFKNKDERVVYSHASFDTDNEDYVVVYDVDILFVTNNSIKHFKYATEEEEQQLFDALAKKGKQWDAEKKQIVDLPKEEKKCVFKPMDWCLMRMSYSRWNLCQYAYYRKDIDMFAAVGGGLHEECIPYNEETKHLLGTTDDWKGGEK